MKKLLATGLSIGTVTGFLVLATNLVSPTDETTTATTQSLPQALADRAADAEAASRAGTRPNIKAVEASTALAPDVSGVISSLDKIQEAKKGLRDGIEEQERQAAAEAAAEAAETPPTPSAPVPAPVSASASGGGCTGLPAPLTVVCQHESGGNPRAYNPTGCIGGCYGLFQMAGEYMGTWAVRAGYPNYNYAGFWPADVQKAVALHMYNQPNGLEIYWCRWTTYC